MLLSSYIYGPIFLILGFIFCAILIVGIKSLTYFIKDKFTIKLIPNQAPTQPKKKPNNKAKRSTIEINADQVDKIYFKKPS